MEKYQKKFTDCNGNECKVTWLRIKGNRPGPVLSIVAGQHGMEHVGPGILPEFAEKMASGDFAGELRICANANPFALLMDYEFYPEKEDLSKIKDYYYSIFRHNYCPWGLGRDNARTLYNMNRLWQREGDHGVAGRITAWLWQEMIEGSHIVLDLHGHQHPALIYSGAGTDFVLSAMPGIPKLEMENPDPDNWSAGDLTHQAYLAGMKSLCFEFSVQHARGEFEFEAGKNYLRNIMKGIRMLEGEIIHDHDVWKVPFDPAEDRKGFVYAEHTGRIRFFKKQNDEVQKGDLLFVIRDVETGEVLQEGRAPRWGIVGTLPHIVITKPGMFCTYVPIPELLLKAGTPAAKYEENWWLK